jgi:hypothetical protein
MRTFSRAARVGIRNELVLRALLYNFLWAGICLLARSTIVHNITVLLIYNLMK